VEFLVFKQSAPGIAPVKSLLLSMFISLWLTPVLASEPSLQAQENAEQAAETTKEKAAEQGVEAEEPDSLLDRHKAFMDAQVQRASTWADAFFQDPSYEAEEAYTQIRIRPEFYYREEQGVSGRFKFRARIALPNLGRKVSLVAGSDEDSGNFDDSVDNSRDDGVIGLQFFLKESRRWNTSISMGVKFNEFAGYFGPRVRFTDVLGDKGSYRFTQTIRYQTNNEWQINSRLDLNRVINDSFFFRQTFDGRWRGEKAKEEGYRTDISSFLTQRLSPESGLQYEFSTVFNTRPDTHVDEYVVSVRYRRRTKRDWLYYEIVPQVSFENEYDYKFNPGIRLRLEIFYGGEGERKFWLRESEDTKDFRW